MQMIFNVFPMGAMTLFVAFSLVIIESYKSLQTQVEDMRIEWRLLSTDQIAMKLRRWKFLHLSICESVDLLNISFGIILLLQITYTFISVIVNIFIITSNQYNDLPPGLKLSLVVVFLKNLINTAIVCYASEIIHRQVGLH